jgi:hypothetical protein
MGKNIMYAFLPIMIALLFLLILNLMFSPIFSITPGDDVLLEELMADSVFLFFFAIALLDFVVLAKWVLPLKNEMVSYVFTELPLVCGFISGFIMGSITPYFYFLPIWALMMAYVYFRGREE